MVVFLQISWDFSALSELEMTLGSSDDINLLLPTQLKELTLSISKVAPQQIPPTVFQTIHLTPCTSLESL